MDPKVLLDTQTFLISNIPTFASLRNMQTCDLLQRGGYKNGDVFFLLR